jgi:colicin import membrane protein
MSGHVVPWTADAELVRVREQEDAARALAREAGDAAASLRADLATVTVERDSARKDVDRERIHGDQRVVDLRTTQDAPIADLRAEIAALRAEDRGQREPGETAPPRAARKTPKP